MFQKTGWTYTQTTRTFLILYLSLLGRVKDITSEDLATSEYPVHFRKSSTILETNPALTGRIFDLMFIQHYFRNSSYRKSIWDTEQWTILRHMRYNTEKEKKISWINSTSLFQKSSFSFSHIIHLALSGFLPFFISFPFMLPLTLCPRFLHVCYLNINPTPGNYETFLK